MKSILLLTLAALSLHAEVGFDAYAFGVSRHSNREYDWKEWNPGGALAPYTSFADGRVEAFMLVGGYKNSTGAGTFLHLLGARGVFGDPDQIHYGVSVAYGVVTGYDEIPMRVMAGAYVGYDRVSLEMAYEPPNTGNEEIPGTATFAAWLRIRIASF